MIVSEDKALLAIQLLIEGTSVRSVERITQLHRDTIIRLLVLAGERCIALMDTRMRNLQCKRIQGLTNLCSTVAAGRYSPSPMIETIVKIRDGRPDPRHISTSYVERQNLTIRMAIRRFTRLTNAFSKKLDNHKAACALHFAYYNFCRITQEPPRDASNGSGAHRSHMATTGTLGVNFSQMADTTERFMCRIELLGGAVVFTCGRCAWTYRGEGDDRSAAQIAFDLHRCENFPAPATQV